MSCALFTNCVGIWWQPHSCGGGERCTFLTCKQLCVGKVLEVSSCKTPKHSRQRNGIILARVVFGALEGREPLPSVSVSLTSFDAATSSEENCRTMPSWSHIRKLEAEQGDYRKRGCATACPCMEFCLRRRCTNNSITRLLSILRRFLKKTLSADDP